MVMVRQIGRLDLTVYVCVTLLHKKLTLNCLVQNGWTALHIASQKGHITTVQALIDRGAQVDLQNEARSSLELDAVESVCH